MCECLKLAWKHAFSVHMHGHSAVTWHVPSHCAGIASRPRRSVAPSSFRFDEDDEDDEDPSVLSGMDVSMTRYIYIEGHFTCNALDVI